MKRNVIAFFLLFSFGVTIAQNIGVRKFEMSERKESVKNDNNGKPCALIIVNSIGDSVEFENTYVVDVVAHENENWVYMAEGAKGLKIKKAGYFTTTISFKDYGIPSLKGTCCYSLIIQRADGFGDIGTGRQRLDSIYKLGWAYKGENLSPVLKLIVKREALGGKKEAQIAMANICLYDKLNDSAVEWVKHIIKEGDSLCLKQMDGELLFQYAIRIPHPDKYDKYNSQSWLYLLGYIVGQLSLKDEYLEASRLCFQAYKKGIIRALDEHDKYNQLAESISVDKLYELMANDREKNIYGEYFNVIKLNLSYEKWNSVSPITYSILRELSNRGSLKAKQKLMQCNKNLFNN